jgi:hypothetical protein
MNQLKKAGNLKRERSLSIFLGLGCLGSILAQIYLISPEVDISDAELMSLSSGAVIFFLWAYIAHLRIKLHSSREEV